jgi:nucleoside triphosphate pyrophosphatase
MRNIILASQSPRRKQLLQWAEIKFDVVVSDVKEDFPADLCSDDIPVFIAKKKALSVQQKINNTNDVIIAADTLVILNDKIIGKPGNRSHAIEILQSLSGNTHTVITGVAILKGKTEIIFSDTTEVLFHKLTDEQINFYVNKYKPFDKAGAYAIQEWIGVVGIKSISGDFYNVMGLPVSRVVQELHKLM